MQFSSQVSKLGLCADIGLNPTPVRTFFIDSNLQTVVVAAGGGGGGGSSNIFFLGIT
jgi:hypothetical protein